MKNPFSPGDVKIFSTEVSADKLAMFDAGLVHPVYSTFACAKDAEWACRLFVLEMKEAGEEGIGSYLSIRHISPAPLGAKVEIQAVLKSVENNKVLCDWKAFHSGTVIAEGTQEQRIINKEKFDMLIADISTKLTQEK